MGKSFLLPHCPAATAMLVSFFYQLSLPTYCNCLLHYSHFSRILHLAERSVPPNLFQCLLFICNFMEVCFLYIYLFARTSFELNSFRSDFLGTKFIMYDNQQPYDG